MQKKILWLIIGILLLASLAFGVYFLQNKQPTVSIRSSSNLTLETQNLSKHLFALSNHLVWGVQIHPTPTANDADTASYTISGKFPGILGIGFVPKRQNSNAAAYFNSKIEDQYNNGGIVTVSWHVRDYVTNGSFDVSADPNWNNSLNVVTAILPHGQYNGQFNQDLDDLASRLNSLRGKNGEKIPVIFRPFHEMNGNWFWWGANHSQPSDYINLFRYTIDYLRNKGVNNMLVAWSPAGSSLYQKSKGNLSLMQNELNKYYPGDNYVDIIGMDAYDNGSHLPILADPKVLQSLYATVDFADGHHKIPAMAEGENNLQSSIVNYWTKDYLSAFESDSLLRQIRYALVWFAPHAPIPNTVSSPSFQTMVSDPYVIMRGADNWYQ